MAVPKKEPVSIMKTSRKISNKKGQTLVEFALVSILFIFLLVVTFNAIIAFTVQQYLSYATFMSARAYQAAKDNPDQQTAAAINMFANFIPGLPTGQSQFGEPGFALKFPIFSKPVAYINRISVPQAQLGEYRASVPSNSRSIGIAFSVPLAELPLGQEIRSRLGFVRLNTVSYFGRQVTTQECRTFFSSFLKKYVLEGAGSVPNHTRFMNDQNSPLFMEDNGC
jgi:hypothetical protein